MDEKYYPEFKEKEALWHNHRTFCTVCKEAIKYRFSNVTLQFMYNKCCEEGKVLYRDYINFMENYEYIKKE